MMIKNLITTICLTLVALAANAQTFTDQLRSNQSGKGHVVINQSSDIDRLVNNTPKPQDVVTPVQTTTTATANNGASNPVSTENPSINTTVEKPGEKTTDKPNDKPERRVIGSTATTIDPLTGESVASSTNKKIMRHSYKATGYRIQVFSGGNTRSDRTRCEQIGARIKSAFPDLPVYVHFYSPSWKCRVGNFTDQSEAQSYLKRIRAMGYNQACLVKGKINVQY